MAGNYLKKAFTYNQYPIFLFLSQKKGFHLQSKLVSMRRLRLTDMSPALNHYFQLKYNERRFSGKFVRDHGNFKLKNPLGSHGT